jgi:hypothetical protein
MPDKSAPAPAYVATIAPLDLDSTPMRQVRLSRRQHRAINGLQVPVVINPRSPLLPCTQAELAIIAAVVLRLQRKDVSAALWRDKDSGDVSVWHDGGFLPIAAVRLTPAREQVAAA